MAEKELEQLTMVMLVIRNEEEALQEPPEDTGIEGVKVLNELTIASSCDLRLCLIYCTPIT